MVARQKKLIEKATQRYRLTNYSYFINPKEMIHELQTVTYPPLPSSINYIHQMRNW